MRKTMTSFYAKQVDTDNKDGHRHLLVNFVEHCWVVVFFRVVMEADHTILLVNASVDLAIFDLQKKHKDRCEENKKFRYFLNIL